MALLSFSGLILCNRMSESEQHKYVGSEQNNVTNNKRSDDIFSDGFFSNLSFFSLFVRPKGVAKVHELSCDGENSGDDCHHQRRAKNIVSECK